MNTFKLNEKIIKNVNIYYFCKRGKIMFLFLLNFFVKFFFILLYFEAFQFRLFLKINKLKKS